MRLTLETLLEHYGRMELVCDNAVPHTCSFSSAATPPRRRRRIRATRGTTSTASSATRAARHPAGPSCRRGDAGGPGASTVDGRAPPSSVASAPSAPIHFPCKGASCWRSDAVPVGPGIGLTELAFLGLRMPRRHGSTEDLGRLLRCGEAPAPGAVGDRSTAGLIADVLDRLDLADEATAGRGGGGNRDVTGDRGGARPPPGSCIVLRMPRRRVSAEDRPGLPLGDAAPAGGGSDGTRSMAEVIADVLDDLGFADAERDGHGNASGETEEESDD